MVYFPKFFHLLEWEKNLGISKVTGQLNLLISGWVNSLVLQRCNIYKRNIQAPVRLPCYIMAYNSNSDTPASKKFKELSCFLFLGLLLINNNRLNLLCELNNKYI